MRAQYGWSSGHNFVNELHELVACFHHRRQRSARLIFHLHPNASTPSPVTPIAATPSERSPRKPPTIAALTLSTSSGTFQRRLRNSAADKPWVAPVIGGRGGSDLGAFD